MSKWTETLREKDGGVLAEVRLDFLQRRVSVPLLFNVETITLEAAEEFTDSVNELLRRLPDLAAVVADAAFSYYSSHIEPHENLERRLPVVANANALLPFYKLTFIYLPTQPEAGYFGLGFEWQLEIEHGMGIRFRDWQLKEIGDESVLFPLE
jgi:hypothetical protein